MNLYAYAGNDPISYSDPYGLCVEDLCIGEAIAVYEVAAEVYEGVKTVLSIASAISQVHEAIRMARAGNSGKEAEGQTAGGRATDAHGNVLGPSGKPAVHEVPSSSRKEAQDKARQAGKGKPVNHPSPSKGDPHYHPTGPDGEKTPGSPHYTYPP